MASRKDNQIRRKNRNQHREELGGRHSGRQHGKRHQQPGKKRWVLPLVIVVVLLVVCACAFFAWKMLKVKMSPGETVEKYFTLLDKGKYDEMYGMLSEASKKSISQKDFVARNQNIYAGIDASDIKVALKGEPTYKDGKKIAEVSYSTKMNSSADEIAFDNKMKMVREDKYYRINWDSTLIFPDLKSDYKVQVDTEPAVRGSILDCNGQLLAGEGTVSEVGIVPGKLGADKTAAVQKIGGILDMTADDINQKLNASYVKADSFVPLKEIPKDDTKTTDELLAIPGILINDKQDRIYPLGIAAGHLTGYVQSVTAEDLKKQKGKGYNENSVIGKSGLELAFEDELRARDGCSIDIVDGDGKQVENVALKPAKDGKNVQVTIDSRLQATTYEQFASDPGAAVAMNPKTGAVLALVSTPGYDPNEFIMGMSDKRWNDLNNDKNKPLTNRWHDTWAPGSVFKAVTAAIGVDSGKIIPDKNLGYVGLSWQKDSSWGDYHVTTLDNYGPDVDLENALIYSDNIYFARAALNIGPDIMSQKLNAMGFGEDIPFELGLINSTYDDDGKIDSDIQLADTGYGQGQVLVNPVHLVSLYSMFVNNGSMLQPTILYKEKQEPKFWKPNVVTDKTAELVKNDLIQVIENPHGTGASAKIDGLTMLGKTGTAEVKKSQNDTTGVERGWFVCETTDDNAPKPIVMAGMVEDVKPKGGSGYVTKKVRNVVDTYK